MCALPSTSPDLSCRIAGVRLRSPLVLAYGIWGTSPSLLMRAARSGAGAVTAKTCTPEPRRGHRNPSAVDWGHGLLNAMGLPNPGAEEEVSLLRTAAKALAPLGVPLIASISADTVKDFGAAAAAEDGSTGRWLETLLLGGTPFVASAHPSPMSADHSTQTFMPR